MKISLKASAKLELDIKSPKNPKKKKKKKKSWIKNTLMFILQVIAGWAIELFLNRLVALIIKICTNGSFYFYNRMFYFIRGNFSLFYNTKN